MKHKIVKQVLASISIIISILLAFIIYSGNIDKTQIEIFIKCWKGWMLVIILISLSIFLGNDKSE